MFAPPSSCKSKGRRWIGWIALAAGCALVCSAAFASQSKLIITWGGNTSAWNKKLHLNAIRIGCSSAPAGCVQAAQTIASQQHVDKVFLAILLKPSSISYAQQYSALSAANPVLYSVGFDDFVNQIDKLHTSPANAAAMIEQFIKNLKSANSSLRFGVTVYENELSSPELTAAEMADVRNRTDSVHLFVHYREDGPNFAKYVRTAKKLFPSAEIIAGAYPVDRIHYLPCSRTARTPCTQAQEISLFDQTFDVQLHLLQDGIVAGIEFYPGNFGQIDKAGLWRDPRSCLPGKMPECIANSHRMRNYVGEQISKANL
jgi:hypothetical protein